MKLYSKFLVFKWSDIDTILSPDEKVMLDQIISHLDLYRASLQKPRNRYVVINQDEPYFPDVLKLMQAHEQEKRS